MNNSALLKFGTTVIAILIGYASACTPLLPPLPPSTMVCLNELDCPKSMICASGVCIDNMSEKTTTENNREGETSTEKIIKEAPTDKEKNSEPITKDSLKGSLKEQTNEFVNSEPPEDSGQTKEAPPELLTDMKSMPEEQVVETQPEPDQQQCSCSHPDFTPQRINNKCECIAKSCTKQRDCTDLCINGKCIEQQCGRDSNPINHTIECQKKFPGTHCKNFKCIGCINNTDCVNLPFSRCDALTGLCEPECRTDSECPQSSPAQPLVSDLKGSCMNIDYSAKCKAGDIGCRCAAKTCASHTECSTNLCLKNAAQGKVDPKSNKPVGRFRCEKCTTNACRQVPGASKCEANVCR